MTETRETMVESFDRAQKARELMVRCLYTQAEVEAARLDDEGSPVDAIKVEGVVSRYGFNPARIAEAKPEIRRLLEGLPRSFYADTGGGYTFLNLPFDEQERQWGEQPDAENVMCLGIAAGYVRVLLPRPLWGSLPGGVPYLVIQLPGEAQQASA